MRELVPEFLIFLSKKTTDVFWIRNRDYSEQIYISPAYEKIWQRSSREIYQHPEKWESYLHPEDRLKMKRSLEKRDPNVTSKDSFLEEYRIVRPSGEIRHIKDQSFPIFNNKGVHLGFAGIARDVTDEVAYAENLKKAKETAEAASQAKSHFIANMSHDVRTPITGIFGMLQDLLYSAQDTQSLLNSEKILSAEESQHLLQRQTELIKNNAHVALSSLNELLNLCNEILNIAHLESSTFDLPGEAFDPRVVVQHNINLFQSVAEHQKLKLVVEMDKRLPHYLFGLRQCLDRALLNLLSNALKFTEKGSVRLSVIVSENAKSSYRKGDPVTITIKIKDTGIGIPKDKLTEIFEYFTRLTETYHGLYKGFGLGLYTVSQYATAMNGHVTVESTVGKGSCFTLILPFIVDDHADTVDASTESLTTIIPFKKPSTTRDGMLELKKKILLVEDQPAAAMAARLILDRLQCTVDTAENGAEALKKVASQEYDLIFMDIGLPDMDGFTVAKKIRKSKKSQIPIIGLSSHTKDEKHQAYVDAGINDILLKPARPSEMELILHKWAKPSTCLTPVIDWEGSFNACGGNKKLANQLMQMLSEDLKKTQHTIIDAYLKKNMEAVRDELHRCLGGVVYVRLPQLENAIKQFQNAIESKATNKERDMAYDSLLTAIRNFIEALDTIK